MMRPIDADELRNVIMSSNLGEYTGLGEFCKLDALEIVNQSQTIDAKPVIHAHWIEQNEWYHGIGLIKCTCSNCGYTVAYKPGSRSDGRGGKFCDDCGAMMDEKPEAE